MSKYFKILFTAIALSSIPLIGFSQQKESVPFLDSELTEPVAMTLLVIMALLLVVIFVLGKAVFAAMGIYRKKMFKSKTAGIKSGAALIIGFGLLSTFNSFAADAEEVVYAGGSSLIGGLSATSFYLMAGIILLEFLIILMLIRMFRFFAGLEVEKVKKERKKYEWFEKLNKTQSLDAESEAAINLGHDYDGIEELDNPTPPWWNWAFILSVVFAVVYMWVYHVSKSAPLQLEELAIANERAEEARKLYLEKAGNLIDEHSVVYLSEAADLNEGKNIYISACAACHAADGGGTVGPNLVDEFWIHGGSINDVFSVIKYGVPEKGMIAWQDNYTPKQMAQVASYILSIGGTTPANPKEPQGDLYVAAEPQEEVIDGLEEEVSTD